MKISDFLKSGSPVQVDLLTEFPLDSNPSTWTKPDWPDYSPAWSFPRITAISENSLAGQLPCQFHIDRSRITSIVAVGVIHEGKNLFVGNFRPPIEHPSSFADVLIDFVIQPWEQ